MSDRSEREPFVAIIPAAGRSERFGASIEKQFLRENGRTMLERSVRAATAHPEVRGAIVVLAGQRLQDPVADELRAIPGVLGLVAGGATRARSVAAGLAAVRDARYVLVHDAARPGLSAEVLDRVVQATKIHGAAIPVLPVDDTLKRLGSASFVEGTIDREGVARAQTPQGARVDWLEEALAQTLAAGSEPTDEAAALEAAGHRVAVVDGASDNEKITRMSDWRARTDSGEEPSMADLRVGTGFDVHRFGEGGTLMLGGVAFEGEPGLVGHSDADVVLHAAMDAVLGAIALGDIGVHFPPEDEAFRGADSARLAAEVAKMARDRGFRLLNLDLTLLAERPRIRDRLEEMRRSIAGAFEIDPSTVGLKATTLEGLGALGRREGAACQAVALVCRQGARS